MKLSLEGLDNQSKFEKAGVLVPQFNVKDLRQKTQETPEWLHFGAGNIFRAFIAAALQDAIEKGKVKTGVIVAGRAESDMVDCVYRNHDCLSISVLINENGNLEKRVIASVTEALTADFLLADFKRLEVIAASPTLKMISFTITEKGYALKDTDGTYLPIIQMDIANGPAKVRHTISVAAALLLKRYQNGAKNIALVSMDNCSHNGEKLGCAVKEVVAQWMENGFVDSGFMNYINDDTRVSFPLTMIDKITPEPSRVVEKHLINAGFSDMGIIVTKKGQIYAPFVNAEKLGYLIIEDKFPNGKIDIASERIVFTDKETVNRAETMKVSTCLNPLHTALAITGCLLNYRRIAEEMQDEVLLKLVKKIGYDEGLKVVENPGIINPKIFMDEVINKRFPNKFIPDTPQRIATDTSQKMSVRFGRTIKAYIGDSHLSVTELMGIPLAIAAWMRYLVGVDDNGKGMTISPDPLKEKLAAYFKGVRLGDKDVRVVAVLSNEEVFGIDLVRAGLASKIEGYFNEMMAGKGAVRRTLEKYL